MTGALSEPKYDLTNQSLRLARHLIVNQKPCVEKLKRVWLGLD